MGSHQIYLLYEREFIHKNENIYKLGKSKQENMKRVRDYPKGSRCLVMETCVDCDSAERDLLHIFKTKFKQELDFGREYFSGDVDDMRDEIYKYIRLQKRSQKRQESLQQAQHINICFKNNSDLLIENEDKSQSLYCKTRNYATTHRNNFTKHILSRKHNISIVSDPILLGFDIPNMQKFNCVKCDYSTCHKNDYAKHCQTKKHQMSILETEGAPKPPTAAFTCELCNKVFYSFGGLCKHSKKCSKNKDNILDHLIEDNKELKEANKELQTTVKQLIENMMKN